MGMLIDGRWQRRRPAGRDRQGRQLSSASTAPFATASPRTALRALRPRRAAIIFMSPIPVRGRTARRSISRSRSSTARSVSPIAIPGLREEGWTFEDNPAFPDCPPDRRQRLPLSASGLQRRAIRTTPAKSRCRRCGTKRPERIVNNESLRNHPHAQLRVRRHRRRPDRLLSAAAARRDRSHQCAGLQQRQQRRLSLRLCPLASRLRGSLRRAVRHARRDSRRGSAASAISSATRSPRRTGGCSRPWCASTSPISRCSSAIATASPTIRTCGTICASFIALPGVAETVKPRYYVMGYYSISRVNPTGIIPKGTPVDFRQPHDRARFAA